jgi:hypothetical protein
LAEQIYDCGFYGLTHIRATHTINSALRVSERRITRPAIACPRRRAPFRRVVHIEVSDDMKRMKIAARG